MYKSRVKTITIIVVCIITLFSACGKNSKKTKSYDIEKWLDNGENQKVINALGDCSSYSGNAKDECYLNLGAAYFGKANFDMVNLSKEFSNIDDNLSDDNKSKEFNKIVFKKLDDPSLKDGLKYYKYVVDNNDSICNEKDYNTLSKNKKQACLSINPLLISKILNNKGNINNVNKSEVSVSLNQIIDFKDVIKNAAPEIQSEDLVSIISGDNLSSQKDANGNNILDSVEATSIVLDYINNGNNSIYISQSSIKTDVYINNKLINVDFYKLNFGNNKNYYRLTQKINNTSVYTILTTVANEICDKNNSIIKNLNITIDGSNYLPCVKLKDDGNITSLNDSVVNILNNDDLINSIALASSSENNNKTDKKIIDDFKIDICDGVNDNESLCTGSIVDGNLTITQDALIQFMLENKE